MFYRNLKTSRQASQQVMGEAIRQALQTARLVHVTGCEYSDLGWWEQIIPRIGRRRIVDEDTTSFRRAQRLWQEVCFDPQMQHTFRHSKTAQPLYNDGAYQASASEVMYFVCERSAPSGGASLFYDSHELLDLVHNMDSGFCAALQQIPIPFVKGDFLRHEPIIQVDGDRVYLVWNQHRVDPDACAEAQDLTRRFTDFLSEQVVNAERIRSVLLQPGEAVFFHDSELLHGRRALEAQRYADRLFWKGGLAIKRRKQAA